MGELHALDVVGQFGRDLAIGQRAVAFLGNSLPRSEMHFINRNRRAKRLMICSRINPFGVAPLIFEVPNYRRSSWRLLVINAEGISLVGYVILIVRNDVKLV